ncbi:MAG TPA: SIMPL domain-containing protein [Burkholderiales bacterium]|nr:SIMPL domain-containing protein [Burkholderiales bacterium]
MRILIVFMTFLMAVGLAQAQTAPTVAKAKGAKVNLDARASVEVDNDVMRARLFIELEDTDTTRLADKVNRATNDSLKLASGFTGVRAKTSAYTTYPVIDKEKIAHWRSRSEITVEGEDFRRMAEAIGKLQAIMQLGAVDFSVSPAARTKAEEALTQTAIAEFLRKAEQVAKGFKGKGFNVLEATVSADSGFIPPRPMMMKSMAASEAVAAPDLQGGTSRVTINVAGTILILK